MGLRLFITSLRQTALAPSAPEEEEVDAVLWDDGDAMLWGDSGPIAWDDGQWIMGTGLWDDDAVWDDNGIWDDGE